MFSVVIPLYNKQDSIVQTIQSVLSQTFSAFEIVVINDGSTDDSIKKLSKTSDDRIRLIHQENAGVSAARNKGILEAKNKWICFLDADDLWESSHLETLNKMILSHPSEKIFCTSYIRSNQNFPTKNEHKTIVIEDYFKETYEKGIFFWTSIVCVHKSAFDKSGIFNEVLNRGEDLDLWARLGKHNKIVKSTLVTAIYKIDTGSNLSHGKSNYNQSILSTINLKGLKGFERIYFKKMLIRRIKLNLKSFDIKELLKIVAKHNIQLII